MGKLADTRTVSDLENLTAGVKNGSVNLTLNDLVYEFSSAKLVNNIRTFTMRETGLGEFPRLLADLDRALSRAVQGIPKSPSDIQLGNLAFFMPTHIQCSFPYYRQFLPNLGFFASTIPLYIESHAHFLIRALSDDPQLRFSPTLALQLAFRLSTLKSVDELSILPLLRDRINPIPGYSIARGMISRRLERLSHRQIMIPLQGHRKVALLISGQMRDTVNSLRRVSKYFNLEDYSVYVSTWRKPGFTPLDKVRLPRRVDKEALAYIDASVTDQELTEMRSLELENLADTADDLRLIIEDSLKDARRLKVNITDEECPPFKAQSNAWKMHFHNRYWPSKLGHDYFRENYDLVVKIRPDMLFSGFDQLRSSQIPDPGPDILNDHPTWLYETWGFGIGDQLLIGRTETMLNILDIEFPTSLSTQMQTTVFGRTQYVQGHISVGTELWLQGGNPRSMGIRKQGLASDAKLNLSEVTELHNKVKEKSS